MSDTLAIRNCDRCGVRFNPRLRKKGDIEYIGMLCDDCQKWIETIDNHKIKT